MSKKPETNPIDEALFKDIIDNALKQAHKKLTQDAETNESNDTGETCSSDSCDCSCDREVIIDLFSKIFNKPVSDSNEEREVIIDLFSKIFNKPVSDSNEEKDDIEDLFKTICKNTEVNIPVCSALDISLVRRLFKKVYKETGCLNPDELLSSEYSLKFCQVTDSFIISLKSLEMDDDIYIQLNDDGSTQISGTLIDAVIYVDGERKAVDMLYAWAARNLMMSDLVRLDNDED